MGRTDDADAIYERIVERDPVYGPAFGNLTQSYVRTSDFDNAESLIARVQRIVGENDEILNARGIVAVMSGAIRKGQWEPAGRFRVLAVMGGVELDFRDADMLDGTTEINVLAIMGGCNIIVPPDVAVDVNGLGFMGGFTHLRHRPVEEDAPVIRIKGLAVMGGVEVKVKPR